MPASTKRVIRAIALTYACLAMMSVKAGELAIETKATVCFGRFILDLPPGAHIKIGQVTDFMFGDLRSAPTKLNKTSFKEFIKEREDSFKGINPDKNRALMETIVVDDSSAILVTMENIFGHSDYGFEAYKIVDSHIFTSKQKNFESGVFKDEVVNDLKKILLPSIRSRFPDEIPVDPGFCIRDGFIATDGSQKAHEKAYIVIRFDKYPDINFSVYSDTVHSPPSDTLLQRADKSRVPNSLLLAMASVKTLRKGNHKVGDFPGEEVMYLMPTDDGVKVHNFFWEAQGKMVDAFHPMLHAEMSSGNAPPGLGRKVKPSLNDEEALKLFDSLINSIRLRPTGPARVGSVDAPPPLPLGAHVATGGVCPQSGWWQCVDGGDIAGGRRRFFTSGTSMPNVTVLGAPNLWQSLRGEQPSHSINTVWTLVEHEALKASAAAVPAAIILPDLAAPAA